MDALQGVFHIVSLDYVFLGAIALGFALDSLRSGIGRATSAVVALTVALFFSSLVSHTAFIGDKLSSPFAVIGVFVGLVVIIYFFVRRMGLEYLSGGMGQPLQSALAGVAVAAVCVIAWLSIPELSHYWEFGSLVRTVFAEQFRLLWFLAAFLALSLCR